MNNNCASNNNKGHQFFQQIRKHLIGQLYGIHTLHTDEKGAHSEHSFLTKLHL